MNEKCRKNGYLCNNNDCNLCFNKSFASNPKSQYWSNKNNKIARQVFKASHSTYIFNCNICNHEFESTCKQINAGSWCPYCASCKLCNNNNCNYCFNKSFASCEKALYWSNKNKIKPREVFKKSHEKYMFDCNICNHEFENTCRDISNGRWCSYCSNPPKQLCDKNDCNYCFNKSFASHEKAIFWSNKNNKNPRQVFKFSTEKYIFDCNKCNHEFIMRIECITINNYWCSYCGLKKLCSNINCNLCFNKSFASHEKALFWSNKNQITPREIFKSSNEKYLFNCNNCNHEFENRISNITHVNQWCSYCCIPSKKRCDNLECDFCFKKSFASHEKAKYWSHKNKLKPRFVAISSQSKYIFECNECNTEFETTCAHIVEGKWCPTCKNKTEKKLLKWLSINYEVTYQNKYEWCKNIETNRYLFFDFVIEEYKIIIELDGMQHLKQVWNWSNPEEIQNRDTYKMKKANENGYTIIRILQDDVYKDKNDWKNKLIESIKIYDKPLYIYISNNNEYDIYKEKLLKYDTNN